MRRRILRDLIARDVLRAGKEALWSDFQRVLGHLEARAPRTGFWVGGSVSVADVAIFAQVRSLRTPLTPRQAREIELRPVLVDYLDRVDEVTRATRAQRRDPAIEPLRCAS